MENLKLLANDFIQVMQSTKNLSSKTIIAYDSDLKDFCLYVNGKNIDENSIIEYITYLTKERGLRDSTIHRKLVVLKLFWKITIYYTRSNSRKL